MNRLFNIGDKVVPINKSTRIREKDNCATYYIRKEINQDFLYVVGYDEEETKRLKKPCYWCNVVPVIGGDSFTQTDLEKYLI